MDGHTIDTQRASEPHGVQTRPYPSFTRTGSVQLCWVWASRLMDTLGATRSTEGRLRDL